VSPAQGFSERWNGSRWPLQHLAMPTGANAIVVTTVSRPPAGVGTGAGYVATSHGWLTLAERWNGRNWAIQPAQSPAPG